MLQLQTYSPTERAAKASINHQYLRNKTKTEDGLKHQHDVGYWALHW